MRLIPAVSSCVFAALLTLGCSANPEQSQGQRPILFAPGLGMSTLRVDVDPEGITFDADGDMYISSEKGSGKKGHILRFEMNNKVKN